MKMIQLKKPVAGSRRVAFRVKAATGRRVRLIGSFNGWNEPAGPMVDWRHDGIYRGMLSLLPGVYEYNFIIDGQWYSDAANPNRKSWQPGKSRSILKVS